jgi:hypothetical protein
VRLGHETSMHYFSFMGGMVRNSQKAHRDTLR